MISLHEVAVAFLRRKEFLAVLIGVALAGVPMGAFNLWLNYFIEQQGQDEVTLGARRFIASRVEGSIVKSRRAANRAPRRMRR